MFSDGYRTLILGCFLIAITVFLPVGNALASEGCKWYGPPIRKVCSPVEEPEEEPQRPTREDIDWDAEINSWGVDWNEYLKCDEQQAWCRKMVILDSPRQFVEDCMRGTLQDDLHKGEGWPTIHGRYILSEWLRVPDPEWPLYDARLHPDYGLEYELRCYELHGSVDVKFQYGQGDDDFFSFTRIHEGDHGTVLIAWDELPLHVYMRCVGGSGGPCEGVLVNRGRFDPREYEPSE